MDVRKSDKAKLQRRRKASTKSFSRSLHGTFDSPARAAVLEFLESESLYAIQNDDTYGPDLIVYKGFQPKYYVECEVKLAWRAALASSSEDELGVVDEGTFPFSTIQLPERKLKFCKLGIPCEFWILRSDLQYAMIIPDYVVTAHTPVEVPNKYVESGELFYQIPVTECILRKLT
jgi:hypothetical protein